MQDDTEPGSTLPGAPPAAPGGHFTPDPLAPGINGFAITAFVLGLLGFVLFSVIFGIVALAKLRDRPQRGKGLAIAGLCLSGVWLVVGVLVFVLSMNAAQPSSSTGQVTKNGNLSVFSLHAGDCFQNPSGNQPVSGTLDGVKAVKCASPHNAQVVATLFVRGAAYPGQTAFHSQAVSGCQASVKADVDLSKLTASMNLFYLYPTDQTWAQGQHSITCVIADSSKDLTSSLLK